MVKQSVQKAPNNLPYSNKGDLTSGPVRGHLVRLTIPMIWGMLAVLSVQLTDTYFISKLGTTELAGISFTFPVTMTITHLLFGLNVAISSVVSRLIGAKDMDGARRITLHGVMTAFVFSAMVALACYAYLEPLFRLLGADESTLPVIMAYMPVWLIASVVLAIPVNGNSAIRAAGDSASPAMIMVAVALVNVILDPILIFGLFGVPAMGVLGAAVATLISYAIGLAGGLYLLIRVKKLVPTDGLHLRTFGNSLRRLIFIALPASLANIIMPLTGAFAVSLLSQFGPEAVAAFGIVTRVEGFAFLAIIAMAVGMAPVIGQNWGAGLFDRVHQTIRLAIVFNVLWSFVVALALGLGGGWIAGAFSQDPRVVHYTQLFFWIVPFSYALGNLVFGWSSAFNAMGMPQRSFVMIFARAFIFTIPLLYFGAAFYGVIGIAWALAAANLSSGLCAHLISRHLCRRDEKKLETASDKTAILTGAIS